MKSTLTKEGNAVLINGQYYLVNDYTLQLLDMYYDNLKISEIAYELGIDEKKVKKLYNDISDQLLDGKEFKGNINFMQPLKIQWKITNRCNIRCKHCYEGEKNMEQLNDEQIAIVFEKLINSNIQQLTITGGEALLVNNLAGYVRNCLDRGIRINLFTNGILLNSFIDELGEIDNKELLTFEISIDGSKCEHDYIRGEGNYEKTTTNIIYAIKRGYKIITNTVINGVNKRKIVHMMNDLYDMGVSTIQLSNLMIKGWAKDNKDELYISREELQSVYMEVCDKVHFPFCYADITNDVYQTDGLGGIKKEGKNTWRCCAGQARVTIDFNGDVLLCPLCKSYSIGNIVNMSLEEIWNNPMRSVYIDKLINLNKGKNTCFIYDQDIK